MSDRLSMRRWCLGMSTGVLAAEREAVPYGALTFIGPCTKFMAFPADGALRAIDGDNDAPDIVLHAGNAPVVSCRSVQWLAP
ncbi:MAG: hypothetical protein ACJ8GJ_25380 [Vitreoscilla sp.]